LPTSARLEKVSDDGGGDDGDGGDEEERDKLEDVEVGLLRKLDKFRHVFRRHLCSGWVWKRGSIKIWRPRGSIEIELLVMRMLNYRCSRL